MHGLARTQLLTISATAALAFGAVGPAAARAAGGPPPAPAPGPAAPERHRGPHHWEAPLAQTLSVTVPAVRSRAARENAALTL